MLREIAAINPGLDLDKVADGQTILLPANRLSARDREILEGIGAGYRIYPIRAGETLEDVIAKRGITVEEMERLNPGVNLKKLKGGCMRRMLRAGAGVSLQGWMDSVQRPSCSCAACSTNEGSGPAPVRGALR